jgi:Ala-tRNA(Pro) deacylase
MAADALTSRLDSEGIEYELIRHDHTERAADEAAALGLPSESVAKTLVVTTPEGYLRAVLPASERLDLHKLRDVVGAGSKKVHLASEDDLGRDYAEFELGAVPPVGGRKDPILLDTRLSELEELVFEAGDHDESVRLRTEDLRRIASIRVVDLCAG